MGASEMHRAERAWLARCLQREASRARASASRLRVTPLPIAKAAPLAPAAPAASGDAPRSIELAALVDEVRVRLLRPTDALEIAALLESLGITNEVAVRRYGARDVFHLGEQIWQVWMRERWQAPLATPKAIPKLPIGEAVGDYARGFITIATIGMLFAIMEAYRHARPWMARDIVALSVGLSGSQLVTNGFVQGATRRGVIYLCRGQGRAASLFLRIALVPPVLALSAICAVGASAARGFSLLDDHQLAIFIASFAGFGALWLLYAVLSMLQTPGSFALGLAIGLVSGVVAHRLVAPAHGSPSLAASTLVGALAGVAWMGRAARRAFRRVSNGPSTASPVLPATSYLLDEAIPYFKYGTMYMTFVFLPHLIGWLGIPGPGRTRLEAVGVLELGLTLSLVPVLMVEGIAEHSVRVFWRSARESLICTPAGSPQAFAEALRNFYVRRMKWYLALLALASLAAAALFHASLHRGPLLRMFVVRSTPEELERVFLTGLLGYFFLGWSMFNCMFSVTLGRPSFASRALLLGTVVLIAVGAPLSLLCHFSLAPLGFVAGAVALAIASLSAAHRLFASADYYYFSSF